MPAAPIPRLSAAERWRLLLGEAAQISLQMGASSSMQAMDRALAWLYGREGERKSEHGEAAETLERHGGSEASRLSVPEWINAIHELFPKETIERLERDAIERYGIDDVVTNIDVLERATPNAALLAAVLRTKHLMNPAVLQAARKLVAQVVQQLMEKLAQDVRSAFGGTRARGELAARGAASQFAARETLRRNLRHYDPQQRRLIVQRPLFYARTQRQLQRWQIILLVDQSASMTGSVIHSAITAACLWGLPGVKTHLVAFDTSLVDLSDEAHEPVETLMKVQLGGGTDIAKAVGYAAGLIEAPRRAIVVIVSDFYEGGSEYLLINRVRGLTAQGSKVLGLAALDESASPDYDRALAARLVDAGAHVAAMTPGQLAGWLAEKMG